MPRCRRCHRKIKSGEYGPICAKIALFDVPKQSKRVVEPPQADPIPAVKPLLVTFDMFRPPAIDPAAPVLDQYKQARKIINGG